MLAGGADPPALPGEPVALPYDQHRQLRLAPRGADRIDLAQERAELAHAGAGEGMAEPLEQLAIGDACARTGRANQMGAHLIGVGEPAHRRSVTSTIAVVLPLPSGARRTEKSPGGRRVVPLSTRSAPSANSLVTAKPPPGRGARYQLAS